MRLTSLLILLALVAGGVYVVFFTDLLKKGRRFAEGYHEAKSPQEAMDFFRKAIQNRDYETAAEYVTKDYAEQLKRAHEAASDMGTIIDKLYKQMKNSGYNPDKAVAALNQLDPFPTWFKVKDTPKEYKGKTIGIYTPEEKTQVATDIRQEGGSWDGKMFTNPLVPGALKGPFGLLKEGPIELVKEGDAWKLNIPLHPGQSEMVGYYVDHYKGYHTALSGVASNFSNQRYETKDKFAQDLFRVIGESK